MTRVVKCLLCGCDIKTDNDSELYCTPCGELNWRIKQNPDIAAKVLLDTPNYHNPADSDFRIAIRLIADCWDNLQYGHEIVVTPEWSKETFQLLQKYNLLTGSNHDVAWDNKILWPLTKIEKETKLQEKSRRKKPTKKKVKARKSRNDQHPDE